MTDLTVSVSCGLCSEKHEVKIAMPEGWAHRYGGVDDERDGFCPRHAKVAEFAESQCPGCVSGWGDCPLWSAFAYEGRRSLTEADFATIRAGHCPKRINGTVTFSPAVGMSTLDLSKRAPPEAGAALEQAVRDYWIAYPERPRP